MKQSSRRLRKTTLLIDSSDEEEDEDEADEEDDYIPPASTESTRAELPAPAAVTTPEPRGLPPLVQQRLISALNKKGGLDSVTNQSRALQEICDEDPLSFGGSPELKTPRGRRRKTQNFVDKLKKIKSPQQLSKRLAKIEATAAAAVTKQSTIKPSPATKAPPTTTTKSAAPQPTTTALPIIMFRGKGKKSKAQAEKFTEEKYKFDPSEEIYGDLCILRISDEVVHPNYIDCYAILQPAVDIRDVPNLKATLTGSKEIEIITVGTRHTFKNSSSAWLKVLDKLKDKITATKLVSTLKSTMTTLKLTKHAKRITLTFDEEVSNEFLNPAAPEGFLTLVPVPFVYEHETKSKKAQKTCKYKNTEVCVLWRAFVVDSERPLGDEEAGTDDEVEDLMDAMGDILGSTGDSIDHRNQDEDASMEQPSESELVDDDDGDDDDLHDRLRERLREMVEARNSIGDHGDVEFINRQINELVHFMNTHRICLGVDMMPPHPPATEATGPAPNALVAAPAGVSAAIVSFVNRVTKRNRVEVLAGGNDLDAMQDTSSDEGDQVAGAPTKKKGRSALVAVEGGGID